MDERNKIIRDLEEKRGQDIAALEEALEKLGGKLLSGFEGGKKGKSKKQYAEPAAEGLSGTGEDDDGGPDAAAEEYLRCIKNIEDSERQVRAVEEENSNFDKLISDISRKEKDYSKNAKDISSLYAQIGRLALADPSFNDIASAYRLKAEDILANIEVREARLEELEQKSVNLFSMIGKNAESLMIKTLLFKNQSELHRIYRSAGEQFIEAGENFEEGEDDLKEAAKEAVRLKKVQEELAADIALLKEEHKKVQNSFKGDGNPARRIQVLEKKISLARKETANACRCFGGFVLEEKYQVYFKPLLDEDDKKAAERAAAFRMSAEESSVKIEKLKAAIEIDNEKAGIEKLKKSIDSEGRRILAAQEAIAGMEKGIQAAEKRITELKKLI
ncbi:MAG: hypothetical protein LBH43_03835 [Treponema sp.]|jgi:chromosome segregation ATPase|nr:hypothetical protein [Treponema sp.]